MRGVSLLKEEALRAAVEVHSLFWCFGPGCWLLRPRQTRRRTFRGGAVDLPSTGCLAFTPAAHALCPAVAVSRLGVCPCVQRAPPRRQTRFMPWSLLPCRAWAQCPLRCAGTAVPGPCVSPSDQVVSQKRHPAEGRARVCRMGAPRGCGPDAPARARARAAARAQPAVARLQPPLLAGTRTGHGCFPETVSA